MVNFKIPTYTPHKPFSCLSYFGARWVEKTENQKREAFRSEIKLLRQHTLAPFE
jgi:hypothetical protein